MPAHVIRRINAIGKKEKQGRTFRFLNRRGEPYEWSDEVPEDDPEFQGLLDETGDMAVYPDISAELPGVALEEHEQDFQPVTDETPADFRDLAGDALYNAGINPDEALRRANLVNETQPAVIEADNDELVYELTFDLPDAGLAPPPINPAVPLGENRNDQGHVIIPEDTDDPQSDGRRYPTRAHRSVIGNQPYDAYAP